MCVCVCVCVYVCGKRKEVNTCTTCRSSLEDTLQHYVAVIKNMIIGISKEDAQVYMYMFCMC